MSFDIYGQNLRRGYCEVHPDVPEEYPCLFCRQEYDNYKHQKQEYERAMAMEAEEYYVGQHIHYEIGLCLV